MADAGNVVVFVLAGVIVVCFVIVAYFMAQATNAVKAFFRFRGKRLVTCPETRKPAAVDVDSLDAGWEAFVGESKIRLSDCSRWPEREGCGQECLTQIEAAPEDCLVQAIIAKWYANKTCVMCGKPITEAGMRWLGHPPALLTENKRTVSWEEIDPEKLPEMFEHCPPVCWSCDVAESFRREFPDRVTDRRPSRLRVRF